MDIPPHKFFVKILENALVYYALHLVGETFPAFMEGQMLYQLQGIHYINLVLPLLAMYSHFSHRSLPRQAEKSVRTINQQDYNISEH